MSQSALTRKAWLMFCCLMVVKCKSCGAKRNYKKSLAFKILNEEDGYRNLCKVCSRSGKNSSQWTGGNVEICCSGCGLKKTVKPYRAKQMLKTGKYTCTTCRNRNGSNNPNWRGGNTRIIVPYPATWFNIRIKIRERDKGICGWCGEDASYMRGNQLVQGAVHHIDYNKRNVAEKNLITLCAACHGRTNSQRTFWRLQFTILMNKRYLNHNGQPQATV